MWAKLAPLLAEDGITEDSPPVPLAELQAALDRALERYNMMQFTAVGEQREAAAEVLRKATLAIAANHPAVLRSLLSAVEPEVSEQSPATVAGCTGMALGLLDGWLTERDPQVPKGLAVRAPRIVPARWPGARPAGDVFPLARKGRALSSVMSLTRQHGGFNVLHGSVLALGVTCQFWATYAGEDLDTLTARVIR
ncbi:hypothetical protein EEJ42_02080 [Streptomyces botrytidirepellens]|uniref:Uncharacterized protein n=2 Tax=Streptomyces botrytidirepellens TaxID=2486417 RepID=A0A3M8X8N5_9ACTN|nr:hypothetical protein EEJ42_02080 [Streptomyces botrytidirepellens]